MISFYDVAGENMKEHDPNWPQVPNHPYEILIIRGSGSAKTNTILNLINHQPDIDKIYLYAKDPFEAKYQLLINKHERVGSKHCNGPKTFIEFSNNMDDIYEYTDEYNRNKNRKILLFFDDMITDMLNN